MARLHELLVVGFIFIVLFISTCVYAQVSPEGQGRATQLKAELTQVDAEIESAEKENQTYSGGLIKSLISVRLEILKTNRALIQQRIHALESGAAINFTISGLEPDPEMAEKLIIEIEAQVIKISTAEEEAARYSGGLVHAMALSALATQRNTLAMLEQRYYVAEYGLAIPAINSSIQNTASTSSTKPPVASNQSFDCLKIADFDSSVLDSNKVYVELAWKIDVTNSCQESIRVNAHFFIYDADDFELDSDRETIAVPGHGSSTARGTMLVSPPSKAQRMSKQGVRLSTR